MARIIVICGGCGINYKDANGNARHALKTPESGPFECDDAQAERLVNLGVAAYIPENVAAAPQTGEKQQEEQAEGTQETEKLIGHLDAEDLATWDYNDLKKLAADMGVKPASNKKADIIEAIVAVEVEAVAEEDPDDEDESDELPELSAADPE